MRKMAWLAIASCWVILGAMGCGGGDGPAISGPIALVTDKDRLLTMADDIWPGIQEGSGFVTGSGTTGGLRMVSFVNFMDPGSVQFRLAAHVMELPVDTRPEEVQGVIEKLMREGMAMSDWHATRDGTETFSLGGAPTDFERYAVVAAGADEGLVDMEMYVLTRAGDDQKAVLTITGHVNSFDRPTSLKNLDAFLAATPGA